MTKKALKRVAKQEDVREELAVEEENGRKLFPPM